ncbi:MAG TPA: 16S rRNA (guanine(527)-N(7))-methyltransferase RsmG [Allosphingosinicella sp.]|jgi:16S rRNA (guanine527-N7)-methyltransferase|nr:16S rRNA (guanine(527)-N(7))-methyltransferase RsmG [Allosphingosinicella sp.]
MDAEEVKDRLDVPRETIERLEAFVALLRQENERQNLVSKASLDSVWERHILDSAQLAGFAPPNAGTWLDLGSGAGFPGLIVPLFHPARAVLVESRRLRTDFLRGAAEVLGIADRVEILCSKLENLPERPFDVISARAFAPLPKLLGLAERFSTPGTIWILPKGRNAKSELEEARSSWQGDFRLEPSLTDAEAQIVVASRVRHKPRGRR